MSNDKASRAMPIADGVACEPETPEHAYARGVAAGRARCIAAIEASITGWLTPDTIDALREVVREMRKI